MRTHNLATDPWIGVRRDGRTVEVSLRDAAAARRSAPEAA